jgi:hypothetical protein
VSHGRLVSILVASLVANLALADDGLGRLFFTPAQRAALDAGKQINQPKPSDRQARKPAMPASITLNGVVVRSDGERTVWINGKPYQRRDPAGIRVKTNPSSPSSTQLQLGKQGGTVELRVGQQLDGATGKVREVYETMPQARPAEEAASRPSEAKVR